MMPDAITGRYDIPESEFCWVLSYWGVFDGSLALDWFVSNVEEYAAKFAF